MGKLLLIPAALALLAACGTPTLHERRERGLAEARTDLERGRVLYETSCSRCHALFMPRTFPAHEWRRFVGRYGTRARLGSDEKELVVAYLEDAARQP